MTTTATTADPLAALRAATVVAVLRAPSAAAAIQTVEALITGGVTGIEVTYSTPDAAAVIAEIRAQHGDAVYLGAGTVLDARQATAAVAAGAEFLVSPGTEPNLAAAMLDTGVTVLCSQRAMAAGDWASITATAQQFSAAAERVRGQRS